MMAGNEKSIAAFLLENKSNLSLDHLGKIKTLHTPTNENPIELKSVQDIEDFLRPDSAQKKADVLINGKGISLKQTGGSKAFNKFQRKWAKSFFKFLKFNNVSKKISNLDKAVSEFHRGDCLRSYPWNKIFSTEEYKKLLHHLMMLGNQHAMSPHQAELIITAPKKNISSKNIHCYTFDEYFENYKDLSFLAIRRTWTNQDSSESSRAKSIAKVKENEPWVFNDIVGSPNSGFNPYEKDKRTVYYLDIEVKY